MGNIDHYWQAGVHNVDGWMELDLLNYLKQLAQMQDQWGVVGNVGEIGVHHGKFLIALAHLARPQEVCAAIDLFGDQYKNVDGSGVGDTEKLARNFSNYGPTDVRLEFVQRDTLAMNLAERTDICRRYGPFRMFSVDGGHTVEHAVNDLLFAQDVLADGGVIFMDDFYNRHWPGVTEGVSAFFGRYIPRIKPCLMAHNKLFLVGVSHHQKYLEAFSEAFRDKQWYKLVRMYGSEMVVV